MILVKFGSRTTAPWGKFPPTLTLTLIQILTLTGGNCPDTVKFSSFKVNTYRDLFSWIFWHENTLAIGTKQNIKAPKCKLNEKSKTCYKVIFCWKLYVW